MDYGMITEQGDLGLGFDPINEEDKEKIDIDHMNGDEGSPVNED